jgi:EAL domain-containing protein (putative c-di-GMP-specific phosphodiesterase class I)
VSVSWFDLSRTDHRDAVARLAADTAAADARAEDAPLRPISAADLPGLADLLTADRLAPLLRRQRALLIGSATDIRPLYTEIGLSIGAFQRALAPGLDVRARPSLFRCLGDRLDKAMLAAVTDLAGVEQQLPPEPFSLGLGLVTLAAPEFAAFAAALAASSGDAPHRALIRMRLDDVLADFDAFAAARDRLHSQGFRVVLDALSPVTLDVLDPAGFGADFVKIRFPAGTGDTDGGSPVGLLSDAVRRIGQERLIFADIDNEAMVMEALCLGVRRFQGRFIDELVAAMLAKGWL